MSEPQVEKVLHPGTTRSARHANEIRHGDCLELLPEVEKGTVDLGFADPPFNLGKDYAEYDDAQKREDYLDWCSEWIEGMAVALKPGGSLFLHNIPMWLSWYNCLIGELNDSVLKEEPLCFKHWISWDAPTSQMKNILQPAHYGILYYTKGKKGNTANHLRMPHKRCREYKNCNLMTKDYGGKKRDIHPFGPLVSDVWTDIHRCKHKKYRNNHPCQLPVPLMERVLLLASKEGDLVLDCFMGAGTTAVAAKRLGRDYLGTELSREYIDIAEERLAKETTPSRLDDIWVSCHLKDIQTVCDKDIWDRKSKDFREPWKRLFKDFPDDKEDRVKLNTKELTYRPDVTKKLNQLCPGVEKKKSDEQECHDVPAAEE